MDTDVPGGEELRGRALRRADWRFLASKPRPKVTAVFVDGELDEAVRAVSDQVLDGRRGVRPGSCDVAVAVDPDRDTLHSAWSALGEGGACYTEWNVGFRAWPFIVRRRLAAAGFAGVTLYVARPSAAERTPRVWVPLGDLAAAKWYLARTPSRRGPGRIAGRLARRIGLRLGSWLPLVTPICAVAHKPGSNSLPASSSEAGEHDFQVALRRAIGDRRPVTNTRRQRSRREAPWILLTEGRRSINKVVLVALGCDGNAEFVIKMPRTAEAVAGIEQEAAVLEQVRSLVGEIPGIPRVLDSGVRAGIPTVAETALRGVPVSQLAHRIDVRTLGMRAAQWQARLVHPSGPQPRAVWWDRLVEPALVYVESLGSIATPARVRATRAALAAIEHLPFACEQRDFSPWNVLQTDVGLAVLDWESAEPRGLPALDLIYFLTYLAIYRERASSHARALSVHRATIDAGSPHGRVVGECLNRYAELTGLNRGAIAPLRMLCWLIHAESERRRALDAETLNDRFTDGSLFIKLWQQEVDAAWSAAA